MLNKVSVALCVTGNLEKGRCNPHISIPKGLQDARFRLQDTQAAACPLVHSQTAAVDPGCPSSHLHLRVVVLDEGVEASGAARHLQQAHGGGIPGCEYSSEVFFQGGVSRMGKQLHGLQGCSWKKAPLTAWFPGLTRDRGANAAAVVQARVTQMERCSTARRQQQQAYSRTCRSPPATRAWRAARCAAWHPGGRRRGSRWRTRTH